mmetsp:Transcript_57704/g.124794  ORF Transcript_57704/g.124794 Transcript_57704/m.124794 type:complete len:103 (+) Transcript_57704:611-919(+)
MARFLGGNWLGSKATLVSPDSAISLNLGKLSGTASWTWQAVEPKIPLLLPVDSSEQPLKLVDETSRGPREKKASVALSSRKMPRSPSDKDKGQLGSASGQPS